MKAAAFILPPVVALIACSDAFNPPPGLPFSRITYRCSVTGIGNHTNITPRRSDTVPYVIVSFEERLPEQALNQSESGSGTITIRRAAPDFPVLGEVDLQVGSQ